MLRLGALFSFALAVTCLFLPATHPERGDGARRVALWAALGQLRDPGLLVVMLVSFAISLAPPFVYPAGARFLESLGVSPAQVAPLMSLGQVSELLVCLLLGRLFTRFTFRSLFLMGLASSAIRFLIWSIGAPWELVLASLPLHGVSHGLVFLLGQIYVDQRSPRDIRASAQALHLAATGGIGGLAGNMLAGWLCDNLHTGVGTAAPSVNYAAVFAFPALLSVACFCTFAWLFRESSRRSET